MADLARAAATILGGYYGRDSIIRLCSYGATALTGVVKGNSATKLKTISEQLSAARTILRLFDDLPMLLYNIGYRLGKQEETIGLRCFGAVTNVLYQFYFIVEHIAWAGDKGLISVKSGPWWLLCIAIWGAALLSSIFKGILQVLLVRKKMRKLRKEAAEALLNSEGVAQSHHQGGSSLRELKGQEFAAILSIVRNAADLMNAVNWLPAGFLWSQKFSGAQTGLVGTLSSLIFVWESYVKIKPKKE